MQGVLNALQPYLVSQVQQADPQSGDYILMKTNEDVASWTATAERYDLRELLAHCEDFMIRDLDDKLWRDKALVGQEVSRASLLRVLRGLQWSRTQMLIHINQEIYKRSAPDHVKRDYDVGITRLLEWQKSAEAQLRKASNHILAQSLLEDMIYWHNWRKFQRPMEACNRLFFCCYSGTLTSRVHCLLLMFHFCIVEIESKSFAHTVVVLCGLHGTCLSATRNSVVHACYYCAGVCCTFRRITANPFFGLLCYMRTYCVQAVLAVPSMHMLKAI